MKHKLLELKMIFAKNGKVKKLSFWSILQCFQAIAANVGQLLIKGIIKTATYKLLTNTQSGYLQTCDLGIPVAILNSIPSLETNFFKSRPISLSWPIIRQLPTLYLVFNNMVLTIYFKVYATSA